MDAESFAGASEQVQSCFSQSYTLNLLLARKADVAELCDKLQASYGASEPALRPYLPLCAEASEGVVDIGWPYTWGSAHEAALGIAFILMWGKSVNPRQTTDFTISQSAFGLLTTRLKIERAKVLASLRVVETADPPRPEPPAPRLTIDLPKLQATLDGVTYDVPSEQALRWLRVLAEHEGEWISGARLETYDEQLIEINSSKLRKYLPKAIDRCITGEAGKGTRLRLPTKE